MIAGIETMMPAAVVSSASEMPRDSSEASATDPMSPSTPKAWMLPVTVPSRPSSGAMWAMVPSAERNRSSLGISMLAASRITSRSSLVEAWRWLTPTCIIDARAEG